jgi:hypothetical protein
LKGEKFTVLRALERAVSRVAEILYSKQKWFEWTRSCQQEDDLRQEKEKKKVMLENAMFKRQLKQMQARMQVMRAREDERRQEAFLEQAYQERIREEDDESRWDPIEDDLYNKSGDYIDLIKYFLWMKTPSAEDQPKADGKDISEVQKNSSSQNESLDQADTVEGEDTATNTAKSKKKKKKKAKLLIKDANINTNSGSSQSQQADTDRPPPDKTRIEPEADMRHRLQSGSDIKYEGINGIVIGDTFENPLELMTKVSPLPDHEIDQLLKDVVEIKELLFCRLLLSHAALLPVALQANSIEEFLSNEKISETDLRDLCLKLERPGLQEIRDACADLHRTEVENTSAEMDSEEDENHEQTKEQSVLSKRLFSGLGPKKWKPKKKRETHPLERTIADQSGAVVDFGEINDEGVYTKKLMRVKLCGKTIWNYASNTAMTRHGWLHFSIIAKDHDLFSAIHLCRTWDEFFELSTLALFHYFPASNWIGWSGSVFNQQYIKMV